MQNDVFSQKKFNVVRKMAELPSAPLNSAATRILSQRCAKTWQVCPIDYNYDVSSAIITLAVHTLQQISVMQKRYDFLRQPYELSFVLTTRDQIMKAIEAYYSPASQRVK